MCEVTVRSEFTSWVARTVVLREWAHRGHSCGVSQVSHSGLRGEYSLTGMRAMLEECSVRMTRLGSARESTTSVGSEVVGAKQVTLTRSTCH